MLQIPSRPTVSIQSGSPNHHRHASSLGWSGAVGAPQFILIIVVVRLKIFCIQTSLKSNPAPHHSVECILLIFIVHGITKTPDSHNMRNLPTYRVALLAASKRRKSQIKGEVNKNTSGDSENRSDPAGLASSSPWSSSAPAIRRSEGCYPFALLTPWPGPETIRTEQACRPR